MLPPEPFFCLACNKHLSNNRPSHGVRHGKEQHKKEPGYDWRKSIISAQSPRVPENFRSKTFAKKKCEKTKIIPDEVGSAEDPTGAHK